jgi:dienelactone hydrolase
MTAILAMPFVDRDRVVIGGQSRGGILSVAYGGLHGEQVRGVINFVGGWSGSRCMSDVNPELFKRGARYPGETLWLYGEGDPFYGFPAAARASSTNSSRRRESTVIASWRGPSCGPPSSRPT